MCDKPIWAAIYRKPELAVLLYYEQTLLGSDFLLQTLTGSSSVFKPCWAAISFCKP
jgi:hypothetical protein